MFIVGMLVLDTVLPFFAKLELNSRGFGFAAVSVVLATTLLRATR